MMLVAKDWSAGERQLLALAWALTVKGSILMLYEVTSRYVISTIPCSVDGN